MPLIVLRRQVREGGAGAAAAVQAVAAIGLGDEVLEVRDLAALWERAPCTVTCSIFACAPDTLNAFIPYCAVPLLPSISSRLMVRCDAIVMLITDSIATGLGSGWLPPLDPGTLAWSVAQPLSMRSAASMTYVSRFSSSGDVMR